MSLTLARLCFNIMDGFAGQPEVMDSLRTSSMHARLHCPAGGALTSF